MSSNIDMLGNLLSLLTKKITVPTEYHNQVTAVKAMLRNDVSGLVDSLTDFSVTSASVNFTIETESDEFTKILKTWLDNINKIYMGKIPSGINALAEEYFKERWKSSSFPVLKIAGWENVKGILLPSKMFFVDGQSIYAEDKTNDIEKTLLNYDYYLGKNKKSKLNTNVIFNRPYGRWFDKYPTPYLIKRGIYYNWKIIESLKERQSTILDQVIPYLFLIKKGSEMLDREGVTYKDEDLRKIIEQYKNLMESVKAGQTPTRATQWDEELKHLIPDLKNIFDSQLFVVAERNILSGLGFIDIVEATSTSRRESILNPKVFIEEIKKGVKDFKQIIREIVNLIKEKNKSHKKYTALPFHINNSPITAFHTDDFKEKIRQLYDRGRVSSKTAVELIAEVDFETEVLRREQESKRGIEITMYPPIRENREGQGIDIPGEEPPLPKDTDEDTIPDDKKDLIEKENFNIGQCSKCGDTFDIQNESSLQKGEAKCPKCGEIMTPKDLIIAPYQNIKDLPVRIKKNLSPGLQQVFLRVFNQAFKIYKNDARAFRVAWGVIKKIGKKDKNGKWLRKSNKRKLTRAMLEEVLEKEEKKTIDDVMKIKDLEIKEKQNKLLDKLLNNKEKN